MATWEKVHIFYDSLLDDAGTLVATSTESVGDYDIDYSTTLLETNKWLSGVTTNPQYVTKTLTVAAKADYLIIMGHNLNTIGATVAVEYSDTGAFAGEETQAFSEAPSADTVYLKRFTAPGSAQGYWRIIFSGSMSAPPYMTICLLGLETELEYASVDFDPHGYEDKGKVNLTQGGRVAGIHTQYSERSMTLGFTDVPTLDGWDSDTTNLYYKIFTWRNTHGRQQLFVAWELANRAQDVYLMRPSARFMNLMKMGGAYRDISIQLMGRKE